MLLGNKRYSLRKYLFVFLIVIGVILFMYKSPESEMNKNEGLTFWFGLGELLIFLSLVMDGLIAAIQVILACFFSLSKTYVLLTLFEFCEY